MIFGPIKLVLKIVSLVMSLIILYFGITFVQIWMRGGEHSTQNAQAILVFGTAQNNCVPSFELAARLQGALYLFNAHRAPLIAVTGGKQRGDRGRHP